MELEDPDFVSPLRSRPVLEEWESEYITAFYRLTSSRQSGMSLGAIPLSEILAYVSFFDVDDAEEFIYVLQTADNAYLEYKSKEDKKKSKKG